jgi:hypothetical protein
MMVERVILEDIIEIGLNDVVSCEISDFATFSKRGVELREWFRPKFYTLEFLVDLLLDFIDRVRNEGTDVILVVGNYIAMHFENVHGLLQIHFCFLADRKR